MGCRRRNPRDLPSSGAATAVRQRAAAKINLYLHVTGRRDDGYHLLDSLIVFADLADTVSAVPAARFSLRVSGPFAAATPAGADNLVARAAIGLAEVLGRAPDVALTLEKVLPVAAGLGGGSADAAAALRVVCTLWGGDPVSSPVRALAVDLGADVPVCLTARPSRVSDIGTTVAAAPPLPDLPVVLVNPGVALSTAQVFARLAPPFAPPSRFEFQGGNITALATALRACRNDLQAPAAAMAPAIGRVLDDLGQCDDCLLARMSGSGATCFGLFATPVAAATAATAVAARHPNWWVRATCCRGTGS